MSRILLSFPIIFSFYSASAQFNKGDIMIGGVLSYTTNKNTSPYSTDEQKYNSGNFEISIGRAIKENAVFGINISYQPYSSSYGSGPDYSMVKTYTYGIGIFYRVYKKSGKEFYLFGEGGGGYNGSTTSTSDSSGDKLSTGTGYGADIYVTPGIAYKISKKFFMELSIPQIFSVAYAGTNTKTGSTTTGTSDGFNVNANINSNPLNSLGIGFRLIL